MILTRTWERYFLKQIIKVFLLFLFGFYGLYILIDYSNHASSFKHYHFSFFDIALYYGYEFICRLDVLIPFAILIACVKTLCSLNVHNELIALMASGIPLKRLLLPFICFGLFFTALIYFNSEVMQPLAAKHNTKLDSMRTKAKQKRLQKMHQLFMEDGTTLLYQNFDEKSRSFFDAYWVKSEDDIYRIRELYPYQDVPLAYDVDHVQRDENGVLVAVERSKEMLLEGMPFNREKMTETLVIPENEALSELKAKFPEDKDELSEKEARVMTIYYYKMAMPWLCLFAILAPAPFCLRFSRSLPLFMIYALSLFGLVAFYLVMDSASILGERQVLTPAVAIWVPFGLFLSVISYRFARI